MLPISWDQFCSFWFVFSGIAVVSHVTKDKNTNFCYKLIDEPCSLQQEQSRKSSDEMHRKIITNTSNRLKLFPLLFGRLFVPVSISGENGSSVEFFISRRQPLRIVVLFAELFHDDTCCLITLSNTRTHTIQ